MVNKLNEQELEKVSAMLDVEEDPAVNTEVAESEAGPAEVVEQQEEVALSQQSRLTSKTFISQLQRQLDTEKNARNKLEEELKALKEISVEI